MLFWVLLGGLAISAVLIALVLARKIPDGWAGFGGVFTAIAIFVITLDWTHNAQYIGEYTQTDARIQVVSNEIGVLRVHLARVSLKQTQVTLNKDSPIATAINTHALMTKQLIEWQDGQLALVGKIVGKCYGPLSGGIKFMFPLVCKKFAYYWGETGVAK